MGWSDIIKGGPSVPALLGAEVDPYPYISGYGLLRRLTQLGRLMGVELTAIGVRNRVTTDTLLATQRPGALRNKLLHSLGLQKTRVDEFWSPEVWSPLRTGSLLERHPLLLRDCPLCATHGYHCALFQLPFIDCCPWHNVPLRSDCPQCGELSRPRFHQDLRLGPCRCGYNAFDARVASVEMWEFPTAEAETWASQYLGWVAEERKCRLLVVSPQSTDWMRGYAALVRDSPGLDRNLVTTEPAPEIESFYGDGVDPPEREFWGWSLLGGERLLTFAPLPATMHQPLLQATQNAVAALPAGTSTPIELATLNGLDEKQSLDKNITNRPHCLIAPHGLSSDPNTWLNLSAVDQVAAFFCGELLDRVISALVSHDDDGCSRSLQAARSRALDGAAGRRHVAKALEVILVRAYTQGLRMVLSAMLPVGKKPCRGPWYLPTAEIVLESDEIRMVKVCWTTTRPPACRRSMPISTPSSSAGKVKAGSKPTAKRSRARNRSKLPPGKRQRKQ